MGNIGLEVRRDITPAVLRKKALAEKNGRVAARLFGLANILDGKNRDDAAKSAGMTRQTLRDWVVRYNANGIDGLYDLRKGHTKRALTPEQEQELEALVLRGPDSGRVRWRCVDLRVEIEKRFGVLYHKRTVAKVLRRLGLVRLSVRPIHPKTQPEIQEDFKKSSLKIWKKPSRSMRQASLSRSGFKMRPGSVSKAHSPEYGGNAEPDRA
jgi:transposase